MDLKQQIKAGAIVPLALEFKAADGRVSKVKAIAGFTPPSQ